MKATISTIVITICITIALIMVISKDELESSNFSDYESAYQSGLMNKGWIPTFIPKSSYNIREQHYVDVPYINVELSFSENEITVFKNACEFIGTNKYICANSGDPVNVVITNGNHASIKSAKNENN